MTRGLRRRLALALALAWAGVIYYASSQPNPFPFVPRELFTHDKLLHAGAYAALGGLLLAALEGVRLRGALAVAAAVALASAWGASDEWHQSFVPGRDMDPFDWAADTAGGALGAAAAAAFLRRRGGAG